ncbi:MULTISPECIES: hypothetical protein [unclassified Pseudoalteromonas]|uniref:hypothetical protein n=1 Tax=unclassified Pseudoalteromonas TaxID=194690 RepID=UPI001F3A4CBC|nr:MULTISPECIES: hypothetical protein [unclassified Pseudoalteromonas]MCF2828112.1 hypothetical protein [Pseudoalteromonas sp. OF5H-5]MCF2831723.1 hypothetical protein [Pseudoalteromonas sp. DL2-H6]MCF2924105.1 hypothetical protein [Pseudoalteromonas sp. DL2-H1]
MTETLAIQIPQDQPELEAAILTFLQEEYQQNAQFQDTQHNPAQHKDAGLMELLWQVVQIVAVVEGGLQFAERAKRLERVKQLQAVIQRVGKPVYLKVKDQTIDLYHKSADQIMNLLAGDKDK